MKSMDVIKSLRKKANGKRMASNAASPPPKVYEPDPDELNRLLDRKFQYDRKASGLPSKYRPRRRDPKE